MPKLFVPHDYVDQELQKLRQELQAEIAELRVQLAGGVAPSGLAGSGASQTSLRENPNLKMQPLEVTGSASLGFVAEEAGSTSIVLMFLNPSLPQ